MTGHHGTCQIGVKAFPIGEWTMTQVPPNVSGRPEYLAFVRSMRESPDDDLIRLACADWLQENGEAARAEFVRVQVEAHRRETSPLAVEDPCTCTRTADDFVRYQSGVYCGGCQRRNGPIAALRRRERELECTWIPGPHVIRGSVHERAMARIIWAGPAVYNHCDAFHPFSRGFVESVELTAADWIAAAWAILAAHPIRHVTLTTFPPHEWQQQSLPFGWPVHDGQGKPYPLGANRPVALDALEHRWRRIDFHLPPVPTVGATPNLTAFATSLQPPPA